MGLRFVFTLGSVLLAGCAARPEPLQPPIDHPANPGAAAAPVSPPSRTLALAGGATLSSADGAAAEDEMDMRSDMHDMKGMKDMHAGHDPHSPARTEDSPPAGGETARTIYVCPMHKQVRSDQPGKCPICKMKLKARKVSADDAPPKTDADESSSEGSAPPEPPSGEDHPAGHSHHLHGGNK